jgi:hypothetical protein
MKALVPLAIGCGLVGVVAVVLAIVGWDWTWFVGANIGITLLLLVLFRGSVSGADPERPPGVARASAARDVGPFDPDHLAESEAGLNADPDANAEARAEDLDTGFAFVWTAAAPAAAAVLAIIFAF